MRAEWLSSSVFAILAKGLLLFLISLGMIACGNESSRSSRQVASRGGGETDADQTSTELDPDTEPGRDSAANASDTARRQGPEPIDAGNSVEFETVKPDEPSPEEESSGNSNTGSVPPNSSPPPPEDPPDADPSRSTLKFTTDPEQATVTIENQETGTRKTKETPAAFEVPPGLYSWTVEKDGYASKESRQAINLRTQSQAVDTVSLVSVSGEGAYLKRANRAHQQGEYQQAATLYRQVPEPSANQDPTDYLSAQMQLGRINWQQEKDYKAAIQAYQKVTEYDNTRYEAFLNLARMRFETDSYEKVIENLDRVNELKYRIPAQNQKRQRITLRARYLRGRALLQLAKNEQTRNRRAKALRANQAFQGFLSTVPPRLKSTFSQQLQGARQKKNEVRTLLREEIR
jgi:hypothetical protein